MGAEADVPWNLATFPTSSLGPKTASLKRYKSILSKAGSKREELSIITLKSTQRRVLLEIENPNEKSEITLSNHMTIAMNANVSYQNCLMRINIATKKLLIVNDLRIRAFLKEWRVIAREINKTTKILNSIMWDQERVLTTKSRRKIDQDENSGQHHVRSRTCAHDFSRGANVMTSLSIRSSVVYIVYRKSSSCIFSSRFRFHCSSCLVTPHSCEDDHSIFPCTRSYRDVALISSSISISFLHWFIERLLNFFRGECFLNWIIRYSHCILFLT